MSYKMSKESKNYQRDWLKERRQRKYWEEKYKELEATIKDDNKDLKMSEAKEDYDKAMTDLHKAHDELVEQLEQCQAALKECQEECRRKDEELTKLREDLGHLIAPGEMKRQVADPKAKEILGDDEEEEGDLKSEGAESKEDTSDGTSSGTSDEEEEESYLEKLRF